MSLKRIISLAVLLLAIAAPSFGKGGDSGISVSDAEVRRENTKFIISYNITLPEGVSWANIRVAMSTDGGATFSRKLPDGVLSGDFGKICSSGSKTVVYDFTDNKDNLEDLQIAFKVEVCGSDSVQTQTLIAADIAVAPHVSYGLMFGMLRKVGGYVKLRSDFRFPSSGYSVNSYDRWFRGTGETQITRLNITGGVMMKAVKWLYPYVGLGYGSYGLYWKDVDGSWAEVSDYTVKGVSFDAGLVFRIGKFSIFGGCSTTNFKYSEFELGAGIMF